MTQYEKLTLQLLATIVGCLYATTPVLHEKATYELSERIVDLMAEVREAIR